MQYVTRMKFHLDVPGGVNLIRGYGPGQLRVGEQVHAMHCTYPFGGWPGQEDCRFEPPVPYESDAGGDQGRSV